MCLGVPGRIVERLPDDGGLPYGLTAFDGLNHPVCLACVPEAAPGDYVIVHAGLAISVIDEAEAERLLADLREMGEDHEARR